MAIDTTMVRSRRSLLAATLAGLAGAAAATVAGAQRVLAAGDDGTPVAVGGAYNDARTATAIVNQTNGATVLSLNNQQQGVGLEAHSSANVGVIGQSTTSSGVRGFSNSHAGVRGLSQGGTGVHGISGDGYLTHGDYPAAVLGETRLPAGVSILGNNYAAGGIALGVQGSSYSPKGIATTGWATKGGTGLVGTSGTDFPTGRVPSSTGVFGYAEHGRGAVFAGPTAQIRLVPSTTATHPASGQAGDLFMDKAHRLWVCKGGTSWVKIA
jgi:hypothetical protein